MQTATEDDEFQLFDELSLSNLMSTSPMSSPFAANETDWTNGSDDHVTTSAWPVAWECGMEGEGSDDEECMYPRLWRLIQLLDMYLIPAVVLFGVVGNLLSLLVFSCTYLRRISSSVYLAALAIVDTVFLIVLLFSWLTNLGIQVYHKPGWCQFFVYVTYVVSFLSVWYVVCFTVERYLTIRFPLKRQQLCRPGRAKVVVLVLAGVALLLYNFAIWTTEVSALGESPYDQPFCQLVTAINNADTLITLIVPSTVIIVSNVRISVALSHFYRSMILCDRQATSSTCLNYPPSSSSAAAAQAGNCCRSHLNANRRSSSRQRSASVRSNTTIYSNSSYNRLQMKVTKMLLLVSSVFLLCNIPSHGVRVYVFLRSTIDTSYVPGHLLVLAQKLIQHLFYANFATNFVLYSVSGKAFRRAMFRLVWCLSHRTASWLRRRRRGLAHNVAVVSVPVVIGSRRRRRRYVEQLPRVVNRQEKSQTSSDRIVRLVQNNECVYN